MASMGKWDCFTEISSRASLVGMPDFSLKIFPLCGKTCPSPFFCVARCTPGDVAYWTC